MRMMHEEDERSPNESPHAYHFCITYNGCELCFLTPFAIVALSKLKGWHLIIHGKGLTLGSRLWCLTVSLSLSHWYPGSGVVLDCINF